VFEVAGEHGPIVLASDAIHYDDELERERPFGIFTDLAGMYRGYATLRRYGSSGAAVVPGHDPSVMKRFAPLDGDAAGLAVCLTDTRSD
jgi:glyoxylase-like metal-dependent hydrolase (beta-lactamase superfamily II)